MQGPGFPATEATRSQGPWAACWGPCAPFRAPQEAHCPDGLVLIPQPWPLPPATRVTILACRLPLPECPFQGGCEAQWGILKPTAWQ